MPDLPARQWRPLAKKLEPILDRVVKAKWATGYAYDKRGLVVKWTPVGERRLKYLAKVMNELGPGPLPPREYSEIWMVVIIYAMENSLLLPGE